jgi:hypothetical protein
MTSDVSQDYSHTQVGYGMLLVSSLVVGGVIAAIAPAFASGTRPPMVFWISIIATAVVVLSLLFHFSRLHVDIRGGQLAWRFGFGSRGYTLPLGEIREARVVQNSWVYGIGIRLTPNGTLYNVATGPAVQVIARDGKRIQLGTDEPERLLASLTAARGAAS